MEWTAQRQSETKVEDRGEPEEAAAEIESGGRQKEIAENIEALTEKSGLFLHLKLDWQYQTATSGCGNANPGWWYF